MTNSLTEAPTGTVTAAATSRLSRLFSWVASGWRKLDEPVIGRRVPGTLIIAVLALIVGYAVSLYTAGNGSNLFYSDAQSHLTIARRITDSKAPGFQQLGTVWLPAPHLMLLPFVQSLWLWKTGWAAAIVGIGCLVASASAIYRITARLGLARAGRLTSVLMFLANPSILYIHTTALTEPVLIAALLGSFAGLIGWVTSPRRLSGGELAVFAGIPAAIAVLSRYEGWALVLGGTVYVLIVCRRWGDSWIAALRMAWSYSFVSIPAIGVLWWISYNFALYGNPLEFMFGEYSASAQQSFIATSGLLPTKYNLGLTLWTYNWAVFYASGAVMLLTALFGACLLIWSRGISNQALLIWLTGVAYLFSIVSLFLGQTAINNAQSLPTTWWNNRFALAALIPLVLFSGVGVSYLKNRFKHGYLVFPAVLLAIAIQNVWWLQDLDNRSAVVAEAHMSEVATKNSTDAAIWLGEHYQGGNILIDETARGNAILPKVGVPLVEYYNRSTGDMFDDARENPVAYAEWVFMNVEGRDDPTNSGPTDLVNEAVEKNPSFAANYELVFDTPTHQIYRRIG